MRAHSSSGKEHGLEEQSREFPQSTKEHKQSAAYCVGRRENRKTYVDQLIFTERNTGSRSQETIKKGYLQGEEGERKEGVQEAVICSE